MAKKEENLIDFKVLEGYIKQVELVIEGLNMIEKDLVLAQSIARHKRRIQQTQAQDMMGNVKIGGLLKRAMGVMGKESEEEK